VFSSLHVFFSDIVASVCLIASVCVGALSSDGVALSSDGVALYSDGVALYSDCDIVAVCLCDCVCGVFV
jgi:hypothetical protein